MSNDGRSLEALVAFVEEVHLPPGFNIACRERVYEDGVQVAEFDVRIRGRLGTTEISWLIECRDRPSDGPQGGEWIDALVGRGQYFGFNKITAVSATGFTQGAEARAAKGNVELREVRSLSPEAFRDWLAVGSLTRTQPVAHLRSMKLYPRPDATDDQERAFTEFLVKHAQRTDPPPVLRSSRTGELLHTHQAFGALVDANRNWLEGLSAGGPGRRVQATVVYTVDDHFILDTPQGAVPIHAAEIDGDVSIIETEHPLVASKAYLGANFAISEFAAFEAVDLGTRLLTIEMHRMKDTGETHVVARVGDSPVKPTMP